MINVDFKFDFWFLIFGKRLSLLELYMGGEILVGIKTKDIFDGSILGIKFLQ